MFIAQPADAEPATVAHCMNRLHAAAAKKKPQKHNPNYSPAGREGVRLNYGGAVLLEPPGYLSLSTTG